MNTVMSTKTAGLLDAIRGNRNLEEMVKLVKQIDALKVALESVDAFREQSILYAQLEAEALLKVVELGGIKSLRQPHRATAEWLSKLHTDDLARYLQMCNDGLTIDAVYKREVGNDAKLREKIDFLQGQRDWLIDDLREHGIVDIRQYADEVKRTFCVSNPSLASDIIDGTRNRLRKAGAVCIGANSYIYVKRNPDNADKIEQAILLRYQSIINDFACIKAIMKEAHVTMSYKQFHDNFSEMPHTGENYILHVLLALSRMGMFKDADELEQRIAASEFEEECRQVANNLRISRDAYIVSQYNAAKGGKDHE